MLKREPNDDEKAMKPKQIAKITLDVYDDGYVERRLREFYENDVIKKRRSFDHDSAMEFKKCFEKLITDNPDVFIANEIMKCLEINPRVFAQVTLGLPVDPT